MIEFEKEIIDALTEEAGIDRSEIRLDSNLYDLGIDSLSALEILVAMEEKYDIRISENELKDTNNVREIVRIVSNELKKKGEKAMKMEKFYKGLFLVAGLYDFILGLMFFLFYIQIYNFFGINLPNHPEYIQAPAIFIVVLGVMFFYVFKNMYRNADLVKVGALSKIAYSGLTFYHYYFADLHWIFALFAWFDILFLILFILFLYQAKKAGKIPVSP